MLGITDTGDAAAAGTAGSLAKATAVIFPKQPRGNVLTGGEAARLLNSFAAWVKTRVATERAILRSDFPQSLCCFGSFMWRIRLVITLD